MLNADGSVSHKIQYRGYPPSAICIDETQQLLVVGAQDGALKVYIRWNRIPLSIAINTCFIRVLKVYTMEPDIPSSKVRTFLEW